MKQKLSSQNLAYLLNEAIQNFQKAKYEKSKIVLNILLEVDSKNFDALHLMAIILVKQEKLDEAIKYYDRALKLNTKNFELYSNKASCLRQLKLYDQSLANYDLALQLSPDNAITWRNKANLLREINKNSEAEVCENQANKLGEITPIDFYIKGNVHLKDNQFQKAIFCFNQALERNPHLIDALINRGAAYEKINNFKEALDNYDQVLKIRPEFPQILTNKAAVLSKLRRPKEALFFVNQALQLDPKYIPAWCNQAVIFEELGMLEDSIGSCDHALSIDPSNEIAYSNKASSLKNLNRFDEALENCNKAIELKPTFYTPIYNKALLNLHLKNYEQGWFDYDARVNLGRVNYGISIKNLPIWNSDPCESLLIYAEEGIGDEIFYARMLNKLGSGIKKITVQVDKRLIPVMKRSFPHIFFQPRGSKVDEKIYDAQIAIGSLPKVLEVNPALDKERPYLLHNVSLTKKIREFSLFEKNLVCGVSWRSNEKNGTKNINLKDLEPIISSSTCQFINLQYGDIQSELDQLDKNLNNKLNLIDDVDLFNDIEGLFSLVGACDFIVTTSNITAHVAGAIGKECYLLAPYSQGRIWYWHQEKVSTWYPSIQIFSQSKSLDWSQAIHSVCSILHSKVLN
jgi:tetratricopeptide (TPR) repeat protein